MSKFIDVTGQKFGRSEVLAQTVDYISPKNNHLPQFVCRCECGKQLVVTGNALRSGNTKSCGCLKMERGVREYHSTKSLIGKKFGRLTVIEDSGERCFSNIIWNCKCECGNRKSVPTRSLKTGDTKSCGCLRLSAK